MLKKGETVLYGKFAGTEVRVDGKDLLIVKESDILAVIEGKSRSKRKAA